MTVRKTTKTALSLTYWVIMMALTTAVVFIFLLVNGALAISLDLTTTDNQNIIYGFGIAAIVVGALGMFFQLFMSPPFRKYVGAQLFT